MNSSCPRTFTKHFPGQETRSPGTSGHPKPRDKVLCTQFLDRDSLPTSWLTPRGHTPWQSLITQPAAVPEASRLPVARPPRPAQVCVRPGHVAAVSADAIARRVRELIASGNSWAESGTRAPGPGGPQRSQWPVCQGPLPRLRDAAGQRRFLRLEQKGRRKLELVTCDRHWEGCSSSAPQPPGPLGANARLLRKKLQNTRFLDKVLTYPAGRALRPRES